MNSLESSPGSIASSIEIVIVLFLIKNKTITISILEAIEPGLDSKEFTNLIEKKIYSELDNID